MKKYKQTTIQLLQKLRQTLERPNFKAVLTITFFTFLSRGLGLFRQVLIYNRMDKIASDLLIAADKIPSNIAQLLITGAIVSSVLPVASRIESATKDNQKMSDYVNLMLLSLGSLILTVNLIVLIFTPQILSLPFITSSSVLNGFTEAGLFEDYVLITRILLIGTLFFAIQAILNVILFLKKRFVIYALAGPIYNVAYIVGILATPRNGYLTTAWGAVLGVVITTLVYLIDAVRVGYHLQFRESIQKVFQYNYHDFIKTWQVFLPRIFILDSVITANLLITPIAQNLGQITAVDIALSIQGAFFIIITSLSTVVFPDLAKQLNEKVGIFWKSLIGYTKNAMLISFAVTLVTIFGAPLIMALFQYFGKGQGNENYIVLIAQVASLGLVFRAFREILGKYFYVKERLWQPAILSVFGFGGQIFCTGVLTYWQVDSGLNVAISLGINNLAWSLAAFYLIYQDRLKSSQSGNI